MPTRSHCADNLVTFRWVVKHAAARNGIHATFMPKPLYGENGSGMHINQSLSRGGQNAFFDPSDELQLSATAYGYIAGLLEHLPALTAICNPTVNSYKRLIPGYEAPVYIAWSPGNRSAAIRIPAKRGHSTRAELRTPDPTANPYLAFACLLQAGLDGVRRGLRPPEPVNVNIYHLSDEESAKLGIKGLPHNLEDALTALEADSVLKTALGDHIYDAFISEKRARMGRLPRAGARLGVQAVPRPVLEPREPGGPGRPGGSARLRSTAAPARGEQLRHVGQRDVVAAARVRVRVEQLRDLGQQVRRAARSSSAATKLIEATRASTTSRPVGPAVRPRPQLERRERRVGVEAAAPEAGAVARRVAGVRVEDAREVAHPVDALVAPVPDQRHGAARAQDARDLGCGGLGIEPVERLRGDDGVDAGARRAGRPRRPRRAAPRPGPFRASTLAHAGDRLERDHARAAGDELARELARAGAELEQCAPRRGARRTRGSPRRPRPDSSPGRAS